MFSSRFYPILSLPLCAHVFSYLDFLQSSDMIRDRFLHRKLKKSIPRKALTADDISEDVQKGISIRNQLAVWDKLLEYRIQFQKVLALSNQLPPSDLSAPVMKDFLKDAGNGHLYWQCTRNIARASKQLTAIRRQLIDLFPEVKKSLEKR